MRQHLDALAIKQAMTHGAKIGRDLNQLLPERRCLGEQVTIGLRSRSVYSEFKPKFDASFGVFEFGGSYEGRSSDTISDRGETLVP